MFGPHVKREMNDEAPPVSFREIREVLPKARVIENYPDDERGASCLVYGETSRPIHVCCTSTKDVVFLITTYVPTMPTWKTPTERNT